MQVAYGNLCDKNFLASLFPPQHAAASCNYSFALLLVGKNAELSLHSSSQQKKEKILTRAKIEAKHMYGKHIS